MERKLTTIRKISAINPIPGADNIEVATVDGWQMVVVKNQYKEAETVLMMEVDSFLPTDERYEFLRKNCLKTQDGKEGFRIRTIKLKGQISQGLIFPLYQFPELPSVVELGESFDDLLGVVKWEPPVPAQLAGTVKGNFPSRIQKTDQERIQNLPQFFDGRFSGIPFEVSIKLDGSSCTIYYDNGNFGVCSRNLDLKEDESNSFWRVVNHLGLRNQMTVKGRNVAVQGELIGEGIQGNKEKIHGQDLYVFDIWDIDLQRHLTHTERMEYLDGMLVKHVPVLGVYPVFDLVNDMQGMITESGNGKSLNADIREGLVFKSAVLINGNIIGFKCINPAFLLKEKD